MLYLVPTPLGNLEDMTYRAVKVLQEVDMILAEDTRTSGKLLQHYGIDTPMKSFHAHNEHGALPQVIERLKAGQQLALVTDAGTPGISDPGFLIVRACHENGIAVECLPGATAFVPALVHSGLPCDRFYFEGFLPHKKGRQTRLNYLAELNCTFVLYESPHRLLKTLKQLGEICGPERKASVSRELTKMFQEIVTDSLEQLHQHFADKKIRGELVIVVDGLSKKEEKKKN